MLKRSEKEEMVEELGSLFEESNNIFVTDYLGLNVSQITEFRKQLREGNIKYRVAKNTLLRIAAKNKGYEEIVPYFEGPTAVAFGVDDPTVPAKTINEFFKKNGKPEVKAFYADGILYQSDRLKELADLPTKDELIAKIVGTIGAPLTNLVGTLDGLIREFCVTIDQIAKQKEN
jgi:large subunit ribosomal protein L10